WSAQDLRRGLRRDLQRATVRPGYLLLPSVFQSLQTVLFLLLRRAAHHSPYWLREPLRLFSHCRCSPPEPKSAAAWFSPPPCRLPASLPVGYLLYSVFGVWVQSSPLWFTSSVSTYSKISDGWHCSARQIASSVQ